VASYAISEILVAISDLVPCYVWVGAALRQWHTTDKSWAILSTDSVRREKSFVCYRI